MKQIFSLFLILLIGNAGLAQEESTDSTLTIDTVTVRAFEQFKKSPYSPILISSLPASIGNYSSKTSLVNGLNAIAGVRMEERSPGSYRLNIRGSSLRSPFGVRNVKVYWNNIPVTDPGGNNYFNQFAWNNFSIIEIFKGPAGSMYGASTGGLLLLNNFNDTWYPGVSLEYNTGSYDLQNIFASARFGDGENKHQVSYAHGETDGYRVQTKMRRDNFSWVSQVKNEKHELTASMLFTDMYYQTPGGLTLAEFNTNPKAARLAGGGFPSAVNAHAAIYQKNLLVGISNLFRISPGISNTTSLYGAYARVNNPAIRNYEKRTEPSFGGRTFFTLDKKIENGQLRFVSGAEFQQGYFTTQVFKNRNGSPDTLQTDDDVDNGAFSLFIQGDAAIHDSWEFIAGVSLTQTDVKVTRLNIYPVVTKNRSYQNELAPKFSLLKKITNNFHWLASVSRGFSPPTVAEVLPSTGVISTDLEAENGWNYETTFRSFLLRRKLTLELTAFYFKLNDALVQRRDISGGDYFVNAGDVMQKGIEFHADYNQSFHGCFIRYFSVRSDVTLNHFRYGTFIKGTDDFSGKMVPSVPASFVALMADVNSNAGIYLNATYYGASAIYLNDANSAKAEPYQLLGCRAGWKSTLHKSRIRLNIYAGIDNLLDETYSLGNDINAAVNRFYNAAPGRNYYAGVSFQWIKAVSPK